MKRPFRKIAILLALTAALSAIALPACSSRKKGQDTSDSTGSETLESGSITLPEHLSPTESDSERESDITTESDVRFTTEMTTEEETETDPPEPVASLRFVSYGNGTCGVSGIGSCTDVCVIIPERSPTGDIVTAIEAGAFYENTEIKAVQIPSTVSSIGERAFGGCTSLVYISVDKDNKTFTDVTGILYSKDESRLIAFPSASGLSEITISKRVTSISDMAFYSCPSLKSIKYNGSLEDWGKIRIGESNYGLYSASITFAGAQ